jgi:hypothetical protein
MNKQKSLVGLEIDCSTHLIETNHLKLINRALHGYDPFAPPPPTPIRNVYEQRASGNPIGFVVLESVGLVSEQVIFICERILAVRGGFHRGVRL